MKTTTKDSVYVELSQGEAGHLLRLFGPSKQRNIDEYRDFVRRYYQPEAVRLDYCVASEYNDFQYDNRPGYVIVYDALGNELTPLPGMSLEARKAAEKLELPCDEETREQIEEPLTYYFSPATPPKLYLLREEYFRLFPE